MANHQDFFATKLASTSAEGATSSVLNTVPSVEPPFYLTFDAGNLNGNPEVVYITSKVSNTVNHAALAHAHTTEEEVRMALVAAELDQLISSTAEYAPSGAGTTTLDLFKRISTITMPAATQTLAVENEIVGQMFVVEIINTSGQGALTWFDTIKWAYGVTPTLTGTNGKKDVFGFRVTAAGEYDGYIIGQNI